MIKVAITIGCLRIGGAEMFVLNILRSLDYNKFQVLLIVLETKSHSFIENEIEKLPILIRYLNKKKGFRPWILLKQTYILYRFSPHIIHGNVGGMIYSLPYLYFFPNKKAIHTTHTLADREYGRLKRKLLFFLYKRKRVIPVAISSQVKESITKTYFLESENIKYISNGVDTSRFTQKRNTQKNSIILGHVGRFEVVKNHKIMIDIYKMLLNDIPNLELWLIGDGPLYSKIKKMAAKLTGVRFFGNVCNVEEYLNEMDIFIMPSIYEGLPLSLLEAMASGVVVVASRVGGIPDIIEEGRNGFLIQDSSDVSSFAKTIKKILSDKERLKTISLNNIEKANLYDIKHMVKLYEKLYITEGSYAKR